MEKTWYKDRPAIRIRSSKLTALFLPEDGGKMASLRDSDQEFLAQAPNAEYAVLRPDSDYILSECSGFDDMFPTIDSYTPEKGVYYGIPYPDHGEVCRYPMEVSETDNTVCFHFVSRLFPLKFLKTVSAAPDGAICLQYHIHNDGDDAFPYIWAAHCMLAGDKNGSIITPFSDDAPIRMMFGPGGNDMLPRDHLSDFSDTGATYKYYYLEQNFAGWCGYRYNTTGKQLMLHYSAPVVPYLGVWLNNGGFKGMYNIALEPCTAPFDRPDAAEKAGCASMIPAHGSISFSLQFSCI